MPIPRWAASAPTGCTESLCVLSVSKPGSAREISDSSQASVYAAYTMPELTAAQLSSSNHDSFRRFAGCSPRLPKANSFQAHVPFRKAVRRCL